MNKANAAKLQHPYDCFPCCIVFTKSRNSKETDQSVFRRLKNFMPKRARENDMSGLRSLADWALGGGAGGDNNADGGGQGQALSEENPLSPEEMRAQRLAKMEALQRKQQQEKERQQQAQLEPMDVDSSEEEKPREEETTESPPQDKSPPVATPKPPPAPAEDKPKKAKKAKQDATPSEQTRKLQRRKELLLKKVLHIELAGSTTAASTRGSDASSSSSSASASIVQVDTGSTEISPQSVAEILATRLSMEQPSPGSASSQEQPPKLVMSYCGHSFNRAAQELKAMQQSTKKGKLNAELIEILEEIQTQVVSYAATCLIEPDLFPQMAKDAPLQLARCLLVSSSGVMTSLDGSTRSITVGANGSVTTSFYYSLCEELVQQDAAVLERTVAEMVRYLTKLLSKCDSVLDGGSAGDLSGAESSPVVLVTALTALSLHKGAAVAVTQLPSFLLPKAGTAEANEVVQPPRSQSGNLFQLLTNPSPPYRKRSGPALDRETIFGLALRLDIPRNNPAFSHTTVLHQTANAVESAQAVQRQQLRVHQEACYQFLTTLVKYKETRPRVMQWFTDALNVNVGASAMRPDPSKVSSSGLLLNMQVMLLKLCQPFMDKEDKQRLIDPGFVSSSEDHGGVYATTGDDAVTRLGDRDSAGDSTMTEAYNPKNTFIPQCFFFCARSLHFGIVPQLSLYENLLMTIHHIHREFSNANRDPRQEPRFAMYVGKQLSDEVALFQEDMVENTLRFCDLMAKFLYDLDDDVLRTMPEDFVSDACDVIQLIAKYKAKLLRGIEFRYVFKLVVKLLSAKYAKMVRNYNLRAMLGDVLYEVFLPTNDSDRRDVPSSVSTDPLAGGQTFLLSDASSQETLAPSLLLLYGEVEHTGYYDKMSHRAKIASLIKYLWESSEHRPAFRRITQNKDSFIKFANGIMNETNTLIATVMQKLPEIREAQEKMKNTQEWGRLSEEEQSQITSRLDDNEREVKGALPLCNKTLQMFGYLNTDKDIQSLFLLEELCPRLVTMLVHVLTKLVGSRGLELKVDNPENYDFRPKEMLRDLCAIFSLFATSEKFQEACALSGCDPGLLRSAVKTCRRLNLLTGESMVAFEALPDLVEDAMHRVSADEELLADAPDEFLDELMATYMKDPVILPSKKIVDRSTITQHLLNDPTDPFNRHPMSIDDIQPAVELKRRMDKWLEEKRAARASVSG